MKSTYSFLIVSVLVLFLIATNFAQSQNETVIVNPKTIQLHKSLTQSLPQVQTNLTGQTSHIKKNNMGNAQSLYNLQSKASNFQKTNPVLPGLPNSLKKTNDLYLISQVLEEMWNGSAWQNYIKYLETYNSDNTLSQYRVQTYNGSTWGRFYQGIGHLYKWQVDRMDHPTLQWNNVDKRLQR